MNYKTILDLDDLLVNLLADIQKDNFFHNIHELDEYISENQVIYEYEAYTAPCWNLASILFFEGYDLIEYARAFDFKNCDHLFYLVDLMIRDYFLDHCEFN